MRFPKFDRAATTTLICASAVAIVGALLLTRHGSPTTDAPPMAAKVKPTGERPVVDVVFALDTTGSMSGLIESAKQKIWSIANKLMSGQPQPIVRFGLVFYRDTTDEYVTQSMPLTTDIDAVYERLIAAQAGGGGDNPEHVNKALDVAINNMEWKSGKNVLKLVFLVGDAPPHDDYTDTKTSVELARDAAKKGIIINAIRAGEQAATEIAWQAIASASQGAYASIAQDGGTVVVATPYDGELERYNRMLADSSIAYGDAGMRAKGAKRMDTRREMKGEVAASAAAVSGSGGGYLGGADYLSALRDGKASINIPAAEAPEELRGLDADKRKEWVERKQAERDELAKKVAKLSEKRGDYLKKNKPTKADSFDDNVGEMLKEQSKKIGVIVE